MVTEDSAKISVNKLFKCILGDFNTHCDTSLEPLAQSPTYFFDQKTWTEWTLYLGVVDHKIPLK